MCCIISVLFSSKCRLVHNSTSFGSCIIHILNTGCAKILKKLRHQRVNFVTYIHYKARLQLNMFWDWIIFSIKSYCVIHFMSVSQFRHGYIFPSTVKPYTACQCEVTGASSWLCTKDGSLKCLWIFCGATGL
jgi:hypothetical protein